MYRGTVSADGRTFDFQHLPVGKYDLVMVTKDKAVYEGLALGEPERKDLPPGSMGNLKGRVDKQDAFFNHAHIHRLGFDGPTCLLFVERTSDRQILSQDGVALGANLRRLETWSSGACSSQYLVVAAKARAVTDGRLVVTCDDVRASARPILRHRMFTNFTADSEGMDTDKIVQKLIETVPEPGEKDDAANTTPKPAKAKAR